MSKRTKLKIVSNDENVASKLQLQENYKRDVSEHIRKALEIDEKHSTDPELIRTAIAHYSKAIEIIRKAQELKFSSTELPLAKDNIQKFHFFFNSAEERLQVLSESLIKATTVEKPTAVGKRIRVDAPDSSTTHKKAATRKPLANSPMATPPSTPTKTTKPTTPTARSKTASPASKTSSPASKSTKTNTSSKATSDLANSPLSSMDPQIVTTIMNEVVQNATDVSWDDIIGMDQAKQALMETVILPIIRPDIFKGLRAPLRGLLLFGPPGNGKTFIAKAVAAQANATFFSISASALTSKWVGEGEKLVKALFAAAKWKQPSVIFIDEIDSLLSERGSGEHDAMRRMKTEFLVQLDGVKSDSEDKILLMGATNRPQDLDEAVRRRLPKRIYIPLPDKESRTALIKNLLKKEPNVKITEREVDHIAAWTEGYSCADLKELCKDADMEPIRELGLGVAQVDAAHVRPLTQKDFKKAMERIRPSVSKQSLKAFDDWNAEFGTIS